MKGSPPSTAAFLPIMKVIFIRPRHLRPSQDKQWTVNSDIIRSTTRGMLPVLTVLDSPMYCRLLMLFLLDGLGPYRGTCKTYLWYKRLAKSFYIKFNSFKYQVHKHVCWCKYWNKNTVECHCCVTIARRAGIYRSRRIWINLFKISWLFVCVAASGSSPTSKKSQGFRLGSKCVRADAKTSSESKKWRQKRHKCALWTGYRLKRLI